MRFSFKKKVLQLNDKSSLNIFLSPQFSFAMNNSFIILHNNSTITFFPTLYSLLLSSLLPLWTSFVDNLKKIFFAKIRDDF